MKILDKLERLADGATPGRRYAEGEGLVTELVRRVKVNSTTICNLTDKHNSLQNVISIISTYGPQKQL